ncbi:uncharacterized protein MELLADRAFT_108146 [Melampsora larici-populina 98AG31]|uniref:Uncharacterized protein n=1 Tax=Melampsora larici-populina (strain 98AG31 / pathotype 3-4-7) TaxID=747676 RepID=F4RS42_MELLP|nr:uncharacterized protein MELLADRAFT_108146 [Melampsora larici-populina 98AG31]EGG04787.1 hypothetical protein MELLADRAFT_108146 [Melampsora larici-populina 98AG31]
MESSNEIRNHEITSNPSEPVIQSPGLAGPSSIDELFSRLIGQSSSPVPVPVPAPEANSINKSTSTGTTTDEPEIHCPDMMNVMSLLETQTKEVNRSSSSIELELEMELEGSKKKKRRSSLVSEN